jgi:hypothetical protein
MRMQLRTEFAGFDKSQSEHGAFPAFEMDPQLKAVGEQGLRHQAHLILGGIGFRFRVYRAVIIHPFWKLGTDFPPTETPSL